MGPYKNTGQPQYCAAERKSMELHITCIPGDGIGPEIIAEAKKVLEKTALVYGHKMIFEDILIGGASIDVHGVPCRHLATAASVKYPVARPRGI